MYSTIQSAISNGHCELINVAAGIYLANANVTRTVTINGQGPVITTIDGNRAGSVFTIQNGLVVTFTNLTIQNGNTSHVGGGVYNQGSTVNMLNVAFISNTAAFGGGIYNDMGSLYIANSTFDNNVATNGEYSNGGGIRSEKGTIFITHSSFTHNRADSGGGAIMNSKGQLTITLSALNGNSTASSTGGAIFNFDGKTDVISSVLSNNSALFGGGIGNNSYAGGTLNVVSSLLDNNTAGFGGGINTTGVSTRSVVSIINSTLSGNSATSSHGGGIFNGFAVVKINNSTINDNVAASGSGGGIYNNTGNTLIVANSIIANSIGGDCGGSGIFNNLGFNLVEDQTCGFTGGADPRLGPLQNNGGPTPTHALLLDSPAIDTGNPAGPGSSGNACAAIDQRGVSRPQRKQCDIGAYEFPNPSLNINHLTGKPGSYFAVSGANFTPTVAARLTINGHEITTTLPITESGAISILLGTSQGDPGWYHVTLAADYGATTVFVLDLAAPLRAQEGSGVVISVPGNIAFNNQVYLPLIQR